MSSLTWTPLLIPRRTPQKDWHFRFRRTLCNTQLTIFLMTFNISQTAMLTLHEISPTRAPGKIIDLMVGKISYGKQILKFREVYADSNTAFTSHLLWLTKYQVLRNTLLYLRGYTVNSLQCLNLIFTIIDERRHYTLCHSVCVYDKALKTKLLPSRSHVYLTRK